MLSKKKDWLNRPLPELNVMFANVNKKIGEYQVDYGLTTVWIDRVKLICAAFIESYSAIAQNRATGKDMNDWFDMLLNGEPKGAIATAPPVFQTITMPTGAFIGLLDEFREMMRFFKANAVYTVADGENLMIVSPDEQAPDMDEAIPELKPSVDVNDAVVVSYRKGEFGGLELQWRKVGQPMWQLADKSTEKTITFKPEGLTPPEKIELRGVFLMKNQRVGKWSPTYTLTIG